ncbi:VOC family protein [Actinomadura syzygii]|uniref:VOC family protein n=1 Tax=Actinomadura syzygii TaxID=1427538 RepID=UPI0016529FA5|nr:VOC family protein [Actinomadura syzygii]
MELVVADDRLVVEYFTRGLFFDQIALARSGDRRSTLLRSNAAEVIISAPTDPDGPLADHLARHGDSVADIALYHDDLPALLADSHAAGLSVLAPVGSRTPHGPVTARVSGAGSAHHTLISTTSHLLGRLPPGFAWESEQVTFPVPAESRAASVRPQSVDHVAWCLPAEDLEAVTARYRQAFGMDMLSSDQITAGPTVTNSYVLSAPGLVFVLVAPDRRRQPESSGQIDAFLKAHGSAGVQHVAFATNDLVTAVRMHARGRVEFLPVPDAYYDRLPTSLTDRPQVRARMDDLRAGGVLVDHDDSGGLLYQIFTRSPHEGGVLFYELIQREAPSTGFGRRNVRALFEAREAQARVAGAQGSPPSSASPRSAASPTDD